MGSTRQPLWVEWRALKSKQYNKDFSKPVKPSSVNRSQLCGWCWGQKSILEAVKFEKQTVAYLPVVCRNCDGYGVV